MFAVSTQSICFGIADVLMLLQVMLAYDQGRRAQTMSLFFTE